MDSNDSVLSLSSSSSSSISSISTSSLAESLSNCRILLEDIDEIIPRLFVSDFATSQNETILKLYGIKFVISAISTDLRPFDSMVHISGVEYYVLNVLDLCFVNILKHFEPILAKITDFYKTNPSSAILIHCEAGLSRSATLAIAFLMKKLKLGATDGLLYAKKKRPNIEPNPGFRTQLYLYEYFVNSKKELDFSDPLLYKFINSTIFKYVFYLVDNPNSVQLPDDLIDDIKLVNSANSNNSKPAKCRKCRSILFKEYQILHRDPGNLVCVGFLSNFIDQYGIIRELKSKIKCPGCNCNVGFYDLTNVTKIISVDFASEKVDKNTKLPMWQQSFDLTLPFLYSLSKIDLPKTISTAELQNIL